MTNINRREYLKRMAAGAAVVGTLAEDVFGEPQSRKRRRRPVKPPTKAASTIATATGVGQFTDWPATTVKPSYDAPVTLVFDGLMGFFYDGSCDLRYLPGNKHHPTVRYWEKTGTGCGVAVDLTQYALESKRMIVEINRPNSKVDFYEEYPDKPFDDRKNGDKMDFRWLLDLHGDDFYANHDFQVQKKFNRVLRVRHGTFYTRLITYSTFLRVNLTDIGAPPLPMGRMPLLMAAALQPKPSEYVSLLFQKPNSKHQFETFKSFTFTPDKPVQIDFFNSCHEMSCPKPEPNNSEDAKRNDFHFMREVLALKSVPAYGLKLEQEITGKLDPELCGFDEPHAKNSEPAPCMGAGYGGGGGCHC